MTSSNEAFFYQSGYLKCWCGHTPEDHHTPGKSCISCSCQEYHPRPPPVKLKCAICRAGGRRYGKKIYTARGDEKCDAWGGQHSWEKDNSRW